MISECGSPSISGGGSRVSCFAKAALRAKYSLALVCGVSLEGFARLAAPSAAASTCPKQTADGELLEARLSEGLKVAA